ncbi:mitochondrial ribosomal protein L31-domain-containing protein [Syncephalis pseudoplumigaleata]|uniref:Mitochondrial ribosomal protein L31-domain-containing protein n=1 Tax=Syncephalis pseudoplumigaleata TaxID=1712513 RepID=A0A4P9YV15_9FUNG|nr:mitochondrial ribosomal protein L31-domain-containing protein [Syncephalis pseudoplumigaleata]RKP23252.1 mitochondrial ribosomal protein L31-domain-containing protein [Syncephalis pseudoplumigaleata]|eukprot:RKP22547.1 mitochondrial ribosomal protein L31-domain-containing protein [Syncephalis pseudoplumigaleata]
MLGAFRASLVAHGGLLWQTPYRMSQTRKANVRKRLQAVDEVIRVLSETGVQCKALERAKELPKESEMAPRDKYSVFSRKHEGYRKSVHKVPKFTKSPVPRTSPPGF